MIKLLTKIEQDYGLPVAISLAKQAIEQNTYLVRELKRIRLQKMKVILWQDYLAGFQQKKDMCIGGIYLKLWMKSIQSLTAI